MSRAKKQSFSGEDAPVGIPKISYATYLLRLRWTISEEELLSSYGLLQKVARKCSYLFYNATETKNALIKIFVTHGISEVTVPDSAASFKSDEFQAFLKYHGIYHRFPNCIISLLMGKLKDLFRH